MPDFYTGTAYTGIIFNTLKEGLELVRDNLSASGWTVDLDEITASDRVVMRGYNAKDSNQDCIFYFDNDGNSNLRVRGFYDAYKDQRDDPATYVAFTGVDSLKDLEIKAEDGNGNYLDRTNVRVQTWGVEDGWIRFQAENSSNTGFMYVSESVDLTNVNTLLFFWDSESGDYNNSDREPRIKIANDWVWTDSTSNRSRGMDTVDVSAYTGVQEIRYGYYSNYSNYSNRRSARFWNLSFYSFSDPFIHQLTEGTPNRLWLTADSGSAVMLLLDGNVGFGGVTTPTLTNLSPSDVSDDDGDWRGCTPLHFGFLDNVDPFDSLAWYIGRPDYRYTNVWCPIAYHELNNNPFPWWHRLGDDYYYRSNFNDNSQVLPTAGTFDSLATGNCYFHYQNTSNYNAFYQAYFGCKNGVNGLPEFGQFFYLEGRGSSSNYSGRRLNNPPYRRGRVKFLATGLASCAAFEIYNDQNGNKWMSTNNYGAQGMLVGTV